MPNCNYKVFPFPPRPLWALMRCSAVRGDWLACVCTPACVLRGVSNQCALSTNEGREGPPVQGCLVENSGMGHRDGGCVMMEQLLLVGRACLHDVPARWGGCVRVRCYGRSMFFTYFPCLVRTPESMSQAELLRYKLLRRDFGGRFTWEQEAAD